MRKIWKDKTILMLCVTVFLSYLPEAGQYSCFFVYLRLVMDFSKEAVAMFIAAVGILSGSNQAFSSPQLALALFEVLIKRKISNTVNIGF